MSLEIVHDELATPGCPACAIKHISTAISIIVTRRDVGCYDTPANPWGIDLARASVNLVESMEGYLSHKDFAVGLMNEAETKCCVFSDVITALDIREIRVKLMETNVERDAIISLSRFFNRMDLAKAHLLEAGRELPSVVIIPDVDSIEYLQNKIQEIRNEFFSTPEVGEESNKEGVPEMATKKTTTKKVAAKKTTTKKVAAKKTTTKKVAAKKSTTVKKATAKVAAPKVTKPTKKGAETMACKKGSKKSCGGKKSCK